MIREAARDEHRALRLTGEGPVAACDLRGRVDGLAAARAEEDCRVLDGRQLGETRGELESRLVRMVAEYVVRSERAELYRNRVCDLGSAVTDVREPETGRRIDVLRSVGVPDPRALAPDEHELVAVDLAHCGERVPEPRRSSGVKHERTLSGSGGPCAWGWTRVGRGLHAGCIGDSEDPEQRAPWQRQRGASQLQN